MPACCIRFQVALGMGLVAKSDQSTGNSAYASYALQSNDLVFAFTAPYAKWVAPLVGYTCISMPKLPSCTRRAVAGNSVPGMVPLPNYSADQANAFIVKHGLAVRAVGECSEPVFFCCRVPAHQQQCTCCGLVLQRTCCGLQAL